jgi:hypothetical protein
MAGVEVAMASVIRPAVAAVAVMASLMVTRHRRSRLHQRLIVESVRSLIYLDLIVSR